MTRSSMDEEAPHTFYVTGPRGLERELATELRELGAVGVRERAGGVAFAGTFVLGYRVCLWSRIANRVLWHWTRVPCPDPETLYAGIRDLAWERHMRVDDTLAVEFVPGRSAITHSQYGAQRVKDGIVDRFRDREGRRPSVRLDHPDLRINVHAGAKMADVAIDLAGESLHRRGYRLDGGRAPVKETLAAGLLRRAGWHEMLREGVPLVDPMCGSGTFVLEAAMVAHNLAPGLLRARFGFERWLMHEPETWRGLTEEARERAGSAMDGSVLMGFDVDPLAIAAAQQNAARAGVAATIRWTIADLARLERVDDREGLVITNPPYGDRLAHGEDVLALHRAVGERLRVAFPNWRVGVLARDQACLQMLGCAFDESAEVFNGPKSCVFGVGRISAEASAAIPAALASGEETEAFTNRVRKNLKRLQPWLEREHVTCHRMYDADIPQFSVAVDRYEDWLYVQEYEPPKEIDANVAHTRLDIVCQQLAKMFEVSRDRVVVKTRRRQRGSAQYERFAASAHEIEVREGGLRFLVNLTDFIDTGLFLDHRRTRALVGRLAQGRSFLNLFAYTGTATVYAAAGGASSSTSVDLSHTYLDWAARNLDVNRLSSARHELVQADCLAWLEHCQRRYQLVFVDPPTFSNSKRMQGTFDVQRDHARLLRLALQCVTQDGIVLFSCNRRGFRLDEEALASYRVIDITRETVSPDFARKPNMHRCWRIERR